MRANLSEVRSMVDVRLPPRHTCDEFSKSICKEKGRNAMDNKKGYAWKGLEDAKMLPQRLC